LMALAHRLLIPSLDRRAKGDAMGTLKQDVLIDIRISAERWRGPVGEQYPLLGGEA
jgi:hypothetical protein